MTKAKDLWVAAGFPFCKRDEKFISYSSKPFEKIEEKDSMVVEISMDGSFRGYLKIKDQERPLEFNPDMTAAIIAEVIEIKYNL